MGLTIEPGKAWNESVVISDPVTGKRIRRMTSAGFINQTPTYHTNSGFTYDGRFLVFVSIRGGRTCLVRGEPETGDLLCLWESSGIGDRSYLHRGMGIASSHVGGLPVDGKGIAGNRVTLAPRAGAAILAYEKKLLSVDLQTGRTRSLLEDCGNRWIFGTPSVSPNEDWVAVPLSSAHPQAAEDGEITRSYTDYPDHRFRLIRVRTDGSGEMEVLHECQSAQSAHCAYSPVDGNLLYFDMDVPPLYWNGGDGETPRIWLYDFRNGAARPLKQSYPGPFQTHQAWLWDGSALVYHGPLPGWKGIYLGATSPTGETLWEYSFPEARFYGHLSPDPRQKALILDGDFSADLLQRFYYETGVLEPLCRHGTEWESIPGQYTHPHPQSDPTGQWISYNAASSGRTDVFCLHLG